MRADKINLIAKKDTLICQYAYCYLKGRRSKGNLDLVRQNIRRLAKLLKFCQDKDVKIKTLFDILKPSHFALILEGVRHIAKYNSETDIFESPTLAMNFGTLLKKCCDIAYIHLVQKNNTSDERKDLAEVAQIKVDAYQTILMNKSNHNSELTNCLNETEKILLNSFTRIVIRGKHGRGVPILLSPKMKEHFDYLILIRSNFVKDNKYIFHTGGHGCIDGTKIVYKLAEKCGIDQTKSISATKLRKHLATIT